MIKEAISNANAVLIATPEYSGAVPHASRLFDERVNLRDEDTRQEIRQLVEAVAHWCHRVQPEEPGGAAEASGSPRR